MSSVRQILRLEEMTNMSKLAAKFCLVLSLLLISSEASAYIGPGMAGGAIATVLGLIGGLGMLVVGAVWYPVKRLVKNFGRKN
jgi:hypothetical protein